MDVLKINDDDDDGKVWVCLPFGRHTYILLCRWSLTYRHNKWHSGFPAARTVCRRPARWIWTPQSSTELRTGSVHQEHERGLRRHPRRRRSELEAGSARIQDHSECRKSRGLVDHSCMYIFRIIWSPTCKLATKFATNAWLSTDTRPICNGLTTVLKLPYNRLQFFCVWLFVTCEFDCWLSQVDELEKDKTKCWNMQVWKLKIECVLWQMKDIVARGYTYRLLCWFAVRVSTTKISWNFITFVWNIL